MYFISLTRVSYVRVTVLKAAAFVSHAVSCCLPLLQAAKCLHYLVHYDWRLGCSCLEEVVLPLYYRVHGDSIRLASL
jgi:hypothetical protein